MHNLNNTLWAVSFLLQGLLLLLLSLRGAVRRLPAFAALLGFYLLRSVLLFTLFGHVSGSAYALLYSMLAVPDLVLQAAVAASLFFAAGRTFTPAGAAHPARRQFAGRLAVFLGLVALACGAALLAAHAVPANPRNPVDRGVLFLAALMLGVAFTCVWSRFTADARRLLEGFLVLSLTGALTQIERTLAAFHRAAGPFRLWSYAEAFVYLAVLCFWLFTLRGTRALLRPQPITAHSQQLGV